MGVPSQSFRATLEAVSDHLRAWVPIVSLTKGLEQGTRLRMSEVANQVVPGHPVAVLTEGVFHSAFTDRLIMADSLKKSMGHRDIGRRNAMIVVSDGDAIANPVDREKGNYYMLGYDRMARAKVYGNREFFVGKAIGWALRELAHRDPEWVRAYVEATPTLSPLSRREATKHL